MTDTTISGLVRGTAAAVLVLLACAEPAAAQMGGYSAQSPGGGGRNPLCLRYESQLATLDRGPVDPAKLAELKRYEDAAAKQQGELDRLTQQSQRLGCQGGGFFSLFSNQPPQCGPLTNQIQQTRANLDRLMGEQQRIQGNSADREGQRRSILVALGQNNCGPQYARYANQGGFFENLFGGVHTAPDVPLAGTYRTLCVRTCDGFYFPISYSTVPGKFADDERLCQRLCPAAETALYSHRNPGEDINRAVSISGQALHPAAQRLRLSQAVQRRLHLPGARTIVGAGAEAVRRPDHRARRHRRADRGAGQGTVAAAHRCAGQADQAGPEGQECRRACRPPSQPARRQRTIEPPVEEDPSKRKVRAVGPVFIPTTR